MAAQASNRSEMKYSRTPQNVSSKKAVDDIRELDCNKFLYTNIAEYLDRNKKQNCTSFKEFLQDNKKVL